MSYSKKLSHIITDAKKGKRQAQNSLMTFFWNDVYNYVNSKVKNENDSEDISIETFTKVFSKLKLYNSDFNFKTWVISIAHNTMIDHIRKFKRKSISLDNDGFSIEIIEDLPTAEELLIQQQNHEELIALIKQLKPEYQELIKLRYLEEKTYKEIASILNLSMANVKVRLLRARKLLAELKN